MTEENVEFVPVNQQHYFEALVELGYESFAVEPDGTVWIGLEDEKEYIDLEPVIAKVAEVAQRQQNNP